MTFPFRILAAAALRATSLVVDSDSESVSFERLAPALAADLGVPVTREPSAVALTVRYHAGKLTVRADHGDGRVLERTVEVDEANVEREASLLASNLARDESREILDDLTRATGTTGTTGTTHTEERPDVSASIGLVYPLATNWGKPHAKTHVDLSLAFGRAGDVEGTQIGLGGVMTDELHGVQTAPVTIAGEVEGLQVGVLNVGRRVKGAQLGVVNIADEVDGVQLGVISISRNSVHPTSYVSNLAYWNLGITFQGKYIYTYLGFTYGTLETKYSNFATTGAVGTRIALDRFVPNFDLEPETNLVSVVPRKGNDIDNNLWLGARLTAGYSFAPHLRVFAGGGARFPLIVNLGSDAVRPEALGGVQF